MFQRPDYCETTLGDITDGFFFSSAPPQDVADPKNLRDRHPWVVVACALERLKKHGDFGVFRAVADAMLSYDDADLWNACGLLFSFAAPYSELRELARLFPAEALARYPELVRLNSKILAHSMNSQKIEEILALYTVTEDEWVRVLVADYLSHMLEDEPSVVKRGPERKMKPSPPPPFEEYYWDYDEYALRVLKVRDQALIRANAKPPVPLLGGRPFSVVELARRILKHARSGEWSPRTNFERMAFEATTGIQSRDFFTQDEHPRFRPLSAAAIVEKFLASPASGNFAVGTRYFFGHPIPP